MASGKPIESATEEQLKTQLNRLEADIGRLAAEKTAILAELSRREKLVIRDDEMNAKFIEQVIDYGGKAVKECFNCGTCSASCPLYTGPKSFHIRRMIRMAQLGLEERLLSEPSLWLCASCYECSSRCPRDADPSELIVALRRHLVDAGSVPKTVQGALEAAAREGNPWGGIEGNRAAWIQDMKVRELSACGSAEVLFFVCCTPSYDTRGQDIARSIAKTLNHAGVDFAILGAEEKCCGDSILRLGERGLFEMLAEHNIGMLNNYGVKKIVTSSPHCYEVIKKHYPELGGTFEIQHYAEFLLDLVNQGKLNFTKKLDGTVTYHDPCFLGRRNGIFDAPRAVLQTIPGLTFIEMGRTRENSFCCGGGGGRMWVEESGEVPETRPAVSRVNEAVATGATTLATGCPYCILTLEDGVKLADLEGKLAVKDLSELVCEAL